MKKLLKLFSIIGLSIVPSMTVVACGSETLFRHNDWWSKLPS